MIGRPVRRPRTVSVGPPSQSVIGFTTRLMKNREGTYGRGRGSVVVKESSICDTGVLLRWFGCPCAAAHRLRRREHAFGGDEFEPRVAQPRQQPVDGGLIDGREREQRVAARQQPELFAAQGMGASLAQGGQRLGSRSGPWP